MGGIIWFIIGIVGMIAGVFVSYTDRKRRIELTHQFMQQQGNTKQQQEQEWQERARWQQEQVRQEQARWQQEQARQEQARWQQEQARQEQAKRQQEQARQEQAKRQQEQARQEQARRQQEQARQEQAKRQQEQARQEQARQQQENSQLAESAKILGVSVHATIDEINRAYRVKMKAFHPDRNVNVTDAVREMIHQEAIKINAARDYLLKQKS